MNHHKKKAISSLVKPSTPDRAESVRVPNRSQIRGRVTAVNGDTSVIGVPPSKRTGLVPRVPNQSDVKKTETETNNELSFLYCKYLQTKMELLIQKQKIQDREKEVLVGLASLASENEHSEQKLDEIKIRKIEINSLNEIQKILDKQICEIKKTFETFDKKTEAILDQISLLLKDLDYLNCKNMKLPQDDEELKTLQSALKRTVDIITALNQMIGTKSSIVSGRSGLKTFVDTHDKLEKQLKPLECSLRKLQIEILTKTSANLTNHQLN